MKKHNKGAGAVMLEFSPDIQEFRQNYFDVCKENQITVHNKAALINTIVYKLNQNQASGNLRQLLFIALMDSTGILISRFYNSPQEKAEEDYKDLQKMYFDFQNQYENTKNYAVIWNMVLAVEKLPEPSPELATDETLYKEQADYVSDLYCNIFETNRQNSGELHYNLRRFLCQAYQITEYHQIMPLFLFQIMVRHASRLVSQENLHLSLKRLWSYKKYEINRNNNKNYRQYKMYSKMFRKLCKYFKNDDSVNIELCKYGFRKISNLHQWIIDRQHAKRKKILDKYYYNLIIADVFCEKYDPYNSYELYGCLKGDKQKYFEEYHDDYCQVKDAVEEYIIDNGDKYILEWIEKYYTDMESLYNCVYEIYNECIPKLPKEKEWIKPCIKAHIFEIATMLAKDRVLHNVLNLLDV